MPVMPTQRHEPLTGRTILLAAQRRDRPHAFASDGSVTEAECPFCAGREERTPPEITRRGDPDWTVRVVPNKYPAVSAADEFDAAEPAAMGRHEVIIESGRHDDSFLEVSDAHSDEIVEVWVERFGVLSVDPRHASVILFHNQGARAGESIAHPHSQIVGLPFVPERVALETSAYREGSCVLCKVIERASESTLIVDQNEAFILIAPWASRLPYQMWAIPRSHEPDIGSLSRQHVRGLAAILRSALGKINRVLPGESINWSIQQAPVNPSRPFHWYLEIVPRVTVFGGFELSTGTYINIVDPEHTAALFRTAK